MVSGRRFDTEYFDNHSAIHRICGLRYLVVVDWISGRILNSLSGRIPGNRNIPRFGQYLGVVLLGQLQLLEPAHRIPEIMNID